ncbi:unnamed protein product, partial [Brenthis ino]
MNGRKLLFDVIVFSTSFYVSYSLMSLFIERYRVKRMDSSGGIAKTFFALIFSKVHCSTFEGKDNGFGNNYVWAGSLESGMRIATHHKKPVMVIIHKSWCSACKNLKPKFANSAEIQTLSKHFVMVNLVDEDEPKNTNFAPDGTYIPR